MDKCSFAFKMNKVVEISFVNKIDVYTGAYNRVW